MYGATHSHRLPWQGPQHLSDECGCAFCRDRSRWCTLMDIYVSAYILDQKRRATCMIGKDLTYTTLFYPYSDAHPLSEVVHRTKMNYNLKNSKLCALYTVTILSVTCAAFTYFLSIVRTRPEPYAETASLSLSSLSLPLSWIYTDEVRIWLREASKAPILNAERLIY